MALEEMLGPQGLWKRSKTTAAAGNDDEDDQEEGDSEEDEEDEEEGDYSDMDDEEEEEEEEEEDFYDHIKTGADDESEEEEEEDENDSNLQSGKSKAQGDFKRSRGVVGLVMQDELVRRGKAQYDPDDDDNDDGISNGNSNGKAKADNTAGFDEVKLRDYELNKLRYYFAIAECDSVETANVLYEQLDGVELEHSSMVFNMKIVPEEVRYRC